MPYVSDHCDHRLSSWFPRTEETSNLARNYTVVLRNRMYDSAASNASMSYAARFAVRANRRSELEKRFDRYADDWKIRTAHLSVLSRRVLHPSYPENHRAWTRGASIDSPSTFVSARPLVLGAPVHFRRGSSEAGGRREIRRDARRLDRMGSGGPWSRSLEGYVQRPSESVPQQPRREEPSHNQRRNTPLQLRRVGGQRFKPMVESPSRILLARRRGTRWVSHGICGGLSEVRL